MTNLIMTPLLILGFSVQAFAQTSQTINCSEAQISITTHKDIHLDQDVEVFMGTDTIFNTRLHNSTLKVQDCPDEAQCWTSKITLAAINSTNQTIAVKIENTYNQKVLKPITEVCTVN